MSDRRAWLDEWCPYCSAAPGSRCRQHRYSARKRLSPALTMHAARGWRERACPSCKALSGEPCHTPSGRVASRPHAARLYPGRGELAARQAVWEELERRGATIAVVPFSGRAGDGGTTGTITLSRFRGRWARRRRAMDVVATSWRSRSRGPCGTDTRQFAGHPWIRGTVTWTVADRCILIAGQRGGEAFEEVARMSPRAGRSGVRLRRSRRRHRRCSADNDAERCPNEACGPAHRRAPAAPSSCPRAEGHHERSALGNEKDRVRGPVFQNIGAFQRRTRIVRPV